MLTFTVRFENITSWIEIEILNVSKELFEIKRYIAANEQTKELLVVLFQEFQNPIRKQFHSSLRSISNWDYTERAWI